MAYSNYIIDFTLTEYLIVTEPVSLAEAKAYIRVSSTVDDAQIQVMIKQAREAVETATGLTFVPKTVSLWFNNIDGNFEIPFGPVAKASFQLFDESDNEITNFRLIGEFHPKLTYPNRAILKATYSAGYITNILPNDLKIAILDQVSYDYENRGLDADTGICNKTWKACQRWTRISPIL